MPSPLYRQLSTPPQPVLIKDSLCMWSDLLGFGEPLRAVNWTPTEDVALALARRTEAAYRIHLQQMDPFTEFALVLNDGITRVMSPPAKPGQLTISMWLRSIVWSHMSVNQYDQANALPGCRTILCAGKRVEYAFSESRVDDFVLDYTRTRQGPSALAEQMGNPVVCMNPTPLQMNMAFAKAYILDSAGSGAGLRGPKFYVDQSVLDLLSERAAQRADASITDNATAEERTFGVVIEGEPHRMFPGLVLAPTPIPVSLRGLNTEVHELLAFIPNDEDAPFRITLSEEGYYVPPFQHPPNVPAAEKPATYGRNAAPRRRDANGRPARGRAKLTAKSQATDVPLTGGERRVLSTVARHTVGVSRKQLSIQTGYKRSARDTYIRRLRTRGFIDEQSGHVIATAKGLEQLGVGPSTTGR